MRVQQLEQMYREGVYRLKEQMKKQEKERLEAVKMQARQEQRLIYEQKLANEKETHDREMRLVQEELNRIAEQAVSLKTRIDELLDKREE